jgi:hypothetical protein
MLGWAVTFLIIANRSGLGIWRHRLGFDGNCESFIFCFPGDVRDLFYLRLERQGHPIIREVLLRRCDGTYFMPVILVALGLGFLWQAFAQQDPQACKDRCRDVYHACTKIAARGFDAKAIDRCRERFQDCMQKYGP